MSADESHWVLKETAYTLLKPHPTRPLGLVEVQGPAFWRIRSNGQIQGRINRCAFWDAFPDSIPPRFRSYLQIFFDTWYEIQFDGHVRDYYTADGKAVDGAATQVKRELVRAALNYIKESQKGLMSPFDPAQSTPLWDHTLELASHCTELHDNLQSQSPWFAQLWHMVRLSTDGRYGDEAKRASNIIMAALLMLMVLPECYLPDSHIVTDHPSADAMHFPQSEFVGMVKTESKRMQQELNKKQH